MTEISDLKNPEPNNTTNSWPTEMPNTLQKWHWGEDWQWGLSSLKRPPGVPQGRVEIIISHANQEWYEGCGGHTQPRWVFIALVWRRGNEENSDGKVRSHKNAIVICRNCLWKISEEYKYFSRCQPGEVADHVDLPFLYEFSESKPDHNWNSRRHIILIKPLLLIGILAASSRSEFQVWRSQKTIRALLGTPHLHRRPGT